MFQINGINWHIQFVSPRYSKFELEDGGYTIGCCDYTTRTIYLSSALRSAKLKHVLCHEIVHAAMFSYNVELQIEQEELLANIIATYGEEIIRITNDIFRRLH